MTFYQALKEANQYRENHAAPDIVYVGPSADEWEFHFSEYPSIKDPQRDHLGMMPTIRAYDKDVVDPIHLRGIMAKNLFIAYQDVSEKHKEALHAVITAPHHRIVEIQ